MALDFLTGFRGWRPTKLSPWDPVLTRFFMLVLHMILVIPCAIAAFESLSTYRFLKRHPELSEYPYNTNTELSYFLTSIGCLTLFPWLFISTVALFKWHSSWILLHGIINLSLFVIICIGTSMQGIFLPATWDGCHDNKAYDWQTIDGHPSFFTTIAKIKKNDTAQAENMCRSMVSDWTTVCATLFFQAALAYVSVFFDDREYSLLNPFRPFFWFGMITFGPAVVIIAILTGCVFPRIRLWTSFVRKGVVRLRKDEVVEIPLQTRYKPEWKNFDVPETRLMEILHIEHVFLNVVEGLHAEDVVNLGLTCRAVREAVYPRNDLHYRMPKLHKFSCNFGEPTACLYCNTKICIGCNQNVWYPGLPGSRHVQCVPYCESCYYTSFATHSRGYKRPCKCHSSDRSMNYQDCCRRCAAKPMAGLQAERHRRYEKECKDNANSKTRCGNCSKELGPGVRWWKCVKCGGECRSKIHPGYVRRGKGDVESGKSGGEGEKKAGLLVRLGLKS